MGYFSRLDRAAQPGEGLSAPAPKAAPAAERVQPKEEASSTVVALEAGTDDTAARQAHEAAESKRRAEWEAEQQAKRTAELGELDRLAAMSDKEAVAASARCVSEDMDRLTGRSMKESVAAHIREVGRAHPDFARLTLHPHKSMLHCIQYIYRQAQGYLEKELKAGGIKSSGFYGGDVPDGLCLQWAEDYFRDPDAKEDQAPEDKFVPRPYAGTAKPVKPPEPPKPTKSERKQKAQEEFGQLSLLEVAG